ncbi:aminodeoxychorismate/anthranilate synthase component II [Chelatococcus sambhunathii]|uniref:Aminodeoxychorismate/anthranilate synthase component II n=1 Tax=Chelatococcus sambhunathii TaxID=363953 RepID=A0ABU1DK51_9HYPH|nr:aminodeoxychorismate/anthranilate synthase component II [Chelatococcus sambhunathii]MDR4308507.1 aminodeoxychorismate/anthranilate synthase component II [Chelatococcus sambhunathii]
MILVVDNYDSFVFNLSRYFEELGSPTDVVRNDAVTPDDIERMAPDALILSPGPCTPTEAGITLDVVRRFSGRIPMLGVCLGHQAIGEAFGGRVLRAKKPLHGRSSRVTHDDAGLFAGLPNPLSVGRYHSLIVEFDEGYDGPLDVTGRSEEGEVMALAHRAHPTFGVQFHPESILTEAGHRLLLNFLAAAQERVACSA